MPKGRYTIGAKGTHGCKGYPVVGDTGKVHGCHTTRSAAQSQQAAIYASENAKKSMDENDDPRIGENCDCQECKDAMNKSMDSDTNPITGEERESISSDSEPGFKWSGMFKPVTPEMQKAKTNYDEMIKPRKGSPANKELYARIIAEAKRKFDVYPSAVANAWVVAEYKRRGGKYNSK